MSFKPLLSAATVLCSLTLTAGAANFFDNFDSYPINSQMHGTGGWKGWDNVAAAGAFTNNDFFFSGNQGLTIEAGSDLVHTFTGATSGLWTFSVMQFVPSTSAGDTYVILLNDYNDGGPYSWSMDVHMDMGLNQVISLEPGTGPGTLPLIKDQWVPFRVEIDLGADTMSAFYNNQLLTTHAWGGAAIEAVDLYANAAGPVIYDDVSLTQVPEPGLPAMLLAGGLVLGARRRKRA